MSEGDGRRRNAPLFSFKPFDAQKQAVQEVQA
jgi:hypothetical protein